MKGRNRLYGLRRHYLEIAGQSGLNPNGRHHVVILKR
jgi:hypothetical protein